jgi:hypothetical protein
VVINFGNLEKFVIKLIRWLRRRSKLSLCGFLKVKELPLRKKIGYRALLRVSRR